MPSPHRPVADRPWLRDRLREHRALVRLARSRPEDPVLVLSRGKVGSSAIGAALSASGRTSLQVHWFTSAGFRTARELRTVPAIVASARYARLALVLRPGRRRDVITLSRDRLAQRVSWFFEIGERNGFFSADDQRDAASADLDALTRRFVAFYRLVDQEWFADELLPATGVDVHEHLAGARREGWDVLRTERTHLLLIRYEDLAAVGPTALASFLGAPEPLPLPEANVGAHKPYGDLYARFRSAASLPVEIVDHAYATREMAAFYTADEIEQFRARWR